MPNYSPNTQGILNNRGVKPRLNKKEFSIKLQPEKKEILEEIAGEFGYKHGGKGSLSALLEAIADDELMLVERPPSRPRQRPDPQDDQSYVNADEVRSRTRNGELEDKQ